MPETTPVTKTTNKPQARVDVHITGTGFYQIAACTPAGTRFLRKVQGFQFGQGKAAAWCDDTRMALDIAEGAYGEGLTVYVNERRYIGNGMAEA